MRDTPRTTKDSLLILLTGNILSRKRPESTGRANSTRGGVVSVRIFLLVLALATLCATGCELLPELGEFAPDLATEEAPILPEAGGAIVTSEVLSVEEASDWPWVDHKAVIADPLDARITDARNGEVLGRFSVASDGNYIDLVRIGENTALQFRVQGVLESSENGELLNRYGRPVAIFSRTEDGRFIVRALGERDEGLTRELFPLPVGRGNRKQGPSQSGWHRFSNLPSSTPLAFMARTRGDQPISPEPQSGPMAERKPTAGWNSFSNRSPVTPRFQNYNSGWHRFSEPAALRNDYSREAVPRGHSVSPP